MMYVLTRKELDKLEAAPGEVGDELTEKIQELCTRVADHEILKTGWRKGQPWGCIHSTEDEWHCDDCPVLDLCPEQFKSWSK